MSETTHLLDIRHIGPQSEHAISGICSSCNDVVLAWIEETENCTPQRLDEKLNFIFENHVSEKHS
jgi:hypothetical protein